MNKKKLIKEETKELIFQKIETALAGITGGVKNKQFEKKLQKASSLLAKDIAKAAKKEGPKKVNTKKGKGENKTAPKKVETKKGKEERKSAKKLKSKKAGKNNNTGPAKMNNMPVVVVGEQAAPENIVP